VGLMKVEFDFAVAKSLPLTCTRADIAFPVRRCSINSGHQFPLLLVEMALLLATDGLDVSTIARLRRFFREFFSFL